jgi:hypothetical protein
MEKLIISARLQNAIPKCVDVCGKRIYISVPEYVYGSNNYFDIRNGEISFSRGPQEKTAAGKWKREGRQTMSASKFAKLLNYHNVEGGYIIIDPPAHIYGVVSDIILGRGTTVNFKISSKISKIYKTETAPADESGYLSSSCMRPLSPHDCRKYSGFYDNIKGLRIIYNTNSDGNLVFRALLWSVVYCGKRRTFLDRIYGTDELISALKFVAIKKGWLYRNFSGSAIFDNEEKISEGVYTSISQDAIAYGVEYGTPYVDTMYLLDELKLKDSGYGTELTNCNGSALADSMCYACECTERDEDLYEGPDGNMYCEDCFYDRFTRCEACGEYVNNEDSHEGPDGNMYCETCFNERFTSCEACGEYVNNEDSHEGPDGNMYCEDCFYDRFTRCEACEEYFDNEDLHEGPDGNMYCEDCFNEKFSRCEACVEYFDNEDLQEGPDGNMYCEDCFDKMNESKEMEVENECK